jgi:hypothetical protein
MVKEKVDKKLTSRAQVVRDGGTTNAPKFDKHYNTLNLDFIQHLKNRTLHHYSREEILNFCTGARIVSESKASQVKSSQVMSCLKDKALDFCVRGLWYEIFCNHTGFQFHMAVNIKVTVLWNMMLCSLVDGTTFWVEEDGDSYSKKLVHLYQTI